MTGVNAGHNSRADNDDDVRAGREPLPPYTPDDNPSDARRDAAGRGWVDNAAARSPRAPDHQQIKMEIMSAHECSQLP
jgi:hypothetical protein